MDKSQWYEVLLSNMGKILGAAAGLFVGFLILRFGLLKGLFLLISMLIGAYLGLCLEKSQSWEDFLSRIWPPKLHN